MKWPFSRRPSITGSREVDAVFEKLARFFEDEQVQLSLYPDALKEKIAAGADVDENANAFGEFGLTLTNPIPVNGPIGEVIYLSSLRYLGKTRILFHRIGSLHGIDIFESVSENGVGWAIFYFDMYHPRKSKKCPKGYSIVPEVSSFRGVNFEVPNFPCGLSKAIAAFSEKTFGISMAEPYVRQAEEQIKFARPNSHVAFLEDLRRGNVQKARRAVSYDDLIKIIIELGQREVKELFPVYRKEIGQLLTQRGALNGNTLLMFEHPSLRFAMLACIAASWCWSLHAVFEKRDAKILLDALADRFKKLVAPPLREMFDDIFGLALNSALVGTESRLTAAEKIADCFFAMLQFNDNLKAVDLIENKAFLSQFSYPFHDRSAKLNSLKAQYTLTEG